MLLILLSLLFCTFSQSHGGCHSAPYYGQPNTHSINELSTSSKLINTVKDGKLYRVDVPESDYTFDVLHVWGTPYEMGYAAGLLHEKALITGFVAKVWAYLESMVTSVLPGVFPKWLDKWIADLGLDVALDLTYDLTKHWTNPGIWEEMKGFCDATGLDFKTAVRIHMLPGLTQGACSMVGAWGTAVNSEDNSLLQLRALDWDMDGPFLERPQLTVYHPNSGNGHAFVTVGFLAFIGGLTGMSEARLGISEIGVSYPDDTFGKESRLGVPFIWLLRDILQYDVDLQNATDRMINTHRTCDLILGVGDGNENAFAAYEYSYEHLYEFGWQDMRPDAEWHPKIKDVIYYGMDWLCPSYSEVLSKQVNKYYGQLNGPLGLQQITSVEQSGDNHLAWYSLDKDEMWVSFGGPPGTVGKREAYARQFTHVDAAALWKEPRPKM